MFKSTLNDPRDQIIYASKALRGLHAIVQSRAAPCYGDAEFPYLLELIVDQLEPAAAALQDYVPRGFQGPDE
jgi:hypothetical protein